MCDLLLGALEGGALQESMLDRFWTGVEVCGGWFSGAWLLVARLDHGRFSLALMNFPS